jgi:hypothetical protein
VAVGALHLLSLPGTKILHLVDLLFPPLGLRRRPRLEVRVKACLQPCQTHNLCLLPRMPSHYITFFLFLIFLHLQSATAQESMLTVSTGEGFTWSDAFRDKTKRSPSFPSSANPFTSNPARNRSASTSASVNAPEPPKEVPKPAPAPAPQKFKKPDHLGERMLRGEFMMD